MTAEQRLGRQLEREMVGPAGQRRVGVVFVHGVGSQPESSTVREFGDPLRRWLAAWHENARLGERFGVLWSRLSYGEHPDGPARFALQIPSYRDPATNADRPAETWIVAEAWWATRLEAPSLPTMVVWSGSIFGRFLGRLMDQVLQRTYPWPLARPDPLVMRLTALVLFVGYLLGALVGYPLLGILFLLAQVPWQPFQEFVLIKLLRPLLVDNIGDFYVYVSDVIQAIHIRRSVLESIRWLVDEERCEHVVVVAHSQGTVVAYDALTTASPTAIDRVRLLVTVGAALNDAWELAPKDFDRLGSPLPPAIRWVNVWATFDPVSHGRILHRFARPPQEYAVTNRLNVLADHGGYVDNPEEFLSFLAQLVEDPADHTRSRFWPGAAVNSAWVERRGERVGVLAGWRLVAIFAIGSGILARGAQLIDDGTAVWSWIANAPAVGGILQTGQRVAEALRELLRPPFGTGPALLAGALIFLAIITFRFGGAERPRQLLPSVAAFVIGAVFLLFPVLFALVLGVAAWGLAATVGYVGLVWIVFDRWNEEQGWSSATRSAPSGGQRAELVKRAAAVLVGVVVIAIVVWLAGPLPASR